MDDPATLYILFALLAGYELYLFSMQRSSLEISREHNIDQKTGRFMLPLWYVSVWPTKIAKYIVIYYIYMASGIWVAVACLVVPFALSAVIPIPHRYFIPMFERKVDSDDSAENIPRYLALRDAITESKKKYLK